MDISRTLTFCLSIFLCFVWRAECEQQRPENITWELLPELPNPQGLGGAFAGVSNGALIVAGGSNFSQTSKTEIKNKVWYKDIYVLPEADGASWLTGFKLKEPRAYGASISSGKYLILIGTVN